MIPSAFDYHAPGTLEEAVALLERHGDEAKVLSGGQSLLPLLKLRLGDAGHLVDIGRIPGLTGITEADGYLRIGGATREADLERSDLIREKYPILLDTAAVIADPLVRNRATVGGNLAHGDPANDHPATMLALEADVVARGPDGERTIPITRFFTGLFATALAPAEILTEIRIPIPPAAKWRRLRQARAQGGGLCHRRHGGAGHARRAGRDYADRDRPHQRRSDADQGDSGRSVSAGETAGRRGRRRGRTAGRGRRVTERRPARVDGVQARHGARADRAGRSTGRSQRAGGQ